MTARSREAMPDLIAETLDRKRLRKAYDDRPSYQRNDYLRWIKDAKQDATRERRTAQMLDELAAGDSYMKMKWNPRDKR